jgi:hypothetical protein
LDNGVQSDTVSRIGVSEKKHGLTRTGLNGGILTPFDSERARAASRARWEKANAAIRRGIARAGEQLPGIQARDSFRVVEVLAEQHALHSYDPSARGSTGSFKMLLDRGFPAPDKSADGASPAPAADPDLRELLDAFRAWKSARGVVVDNDE